MTLQAIISNNLGTIINPLFPILLGLALIMFFWGLTRYLFSGLNEPKQIEGAKSLMIWGVVIITVMISVWGIVQLLQRIFLNGSVPSTPPSIPLFNQSQTPASNPASPSSGTPEDYGFPSVNSLPSSNSVIPN